MAACYTLRGVIGGGQHVHGISDDGDFIYVPTGTGIDRWTFPGFVQTSDWHTKAGGVQSLAVDNGGQIFYRAITGGHLWRLQADATGDTDLGAITAENLVYSPHEDVLYGNTFSTTLYRVTLAGTESTPFTGGTTLFRPTIQRGGIIWVADGFTTLRRFDPDAAFAQTTRAESLDFTTPACPGKSGVNGGTFFYSEGITETALTCTGSFAGLWPTWNSDYSLILIDDGGSGAAQVFSLKCGARPPLRIRQRTDDLSTGSPRINPSYSFSTTAQRSIRIPGPNSHF